MIPGGTWPTIYIEIAPGEHALAELVAELPSGAVHALRLEPKKAPKVRAKP